MDPVLNDARYEALHDMMVLTNQNWSFWKLSRQDGRMKMFANGLSLNMDFLLSNHFDFFFQISIDRMFLVHFHVN